MFTPVCPQKRRILCSESRRFLHCIRQRIVKLLPFLSNLDRIRLPAFRQIDMTAVVRHRQFLTVLAHRLLISMNQKNLTCGQPFEQCRDL